MPTIQAIAETKGLHENATQVTEDLRRQYTDFLLFQSKLIATIEGADEVQAIRVERANEIIFHATPARSKIKEVIALVSSILLGAFLQGFITEYSNNRPNYMVVYAGAGVVGFLCLVFAYRK